MQAQVIRLSRCFITNNNIRHLCSTPAVNAGALWRQKNNLPRSNNEYGPLRDSPDFSFKDGRFIPLSEHQIARKKQQITELKTVLSLLNEVDSIVEKEQQMKREEAEMRQNIIREKLKPKQFIS